MGEILSYGVAEVVPGAYNLTGYTTEGISAGWFVRGSGGCTADKVTSEGTPSLGKTDIQIQRCDAAADHELCVGLMLEDTASGSYGTFATEGVFIVRAGEGINAGAEVLALESAGDAASCSNRVMTAAQGTDLSIGRALTSASAAGKFILIKLRV